MVDRSKTPPHTHPNVQRSALLGDLLILAEEAGRNGYCKISDEILLLAMRWVKEMKATRRRFRVISGDRDEGE